VRNSHRIWQDRVKDLYSRRINKMTEKRNEPNGFFGHWAKHLIENEGVEEVDDTENIEEEYDLGVYGDDDAEQQTD